MVDETGQVSKEMLQINPRNFEFVPALGKEDKDGGYLVTNERSHELNLSTVIIDCPMMLSSGI